MRIASLAVASSARTNKLRRFADDSGASLIEYAVVLGMITAAAIGALGMLGSYATQSLSSGAGSISV